MALVVEYEGRMPVVADTAWVAPNATLVGGVTLGENVGIFYGTVLRADMDTITVGDNSNLQDNVTVHCDFGKPTVVGARVSVGHGAILHGCTVEDDVLIGMAATVLNGAVIGTGSLIAAGSVVLEGTIIPPRSLVAGVPAKVRREVTESDYEHITLNWQHYLKITAAHKAAHAE